MVDLDAAVGEKLFEVPVGQPVPQEPEAKPNQFGGECRWEPVFLQVHYSLGQVQTFDVSKHHS